MFIKQKIIEIREKIKIFKISTQNNIENLKYLSMYKCDKKSHIEYQILLLVHSLEKGLCLDNVRYGFGQAKIKNLINLLHLYIKKEFNTDEYAFKEGINILDSYIKFHKKVDYDVDFLEQNVNKIKKQLNIQENENFAGVKRYTHEELKRASEFNFNEFIELRHSIRNFSKENVSEELILEAIEMAQGSPSACNRQPNKVYYSLSNEANSIIDNIIPGNQGFKGVVNKYLIVTCDMEAFGSLEVNQWYVNGGIYSAFLLLSLHSKGVGTCAFQWAAIKEKDILLRKLAGIPDNEKIVLVIGVGHYKDELNIPIALRKDINDIVKVF